jgi:hypothetical protein
MGVLYTIVSILEYLSYDGPPYSLLWVASHSALRFQLPHRPIDRWGLLHQRFGWTKLGGIRG